MMDGGKLSAFIDFDGAASGDPAFGLVIAWTYLLTHVTQPLTRPHNMSYLSSKAREIFISEMDLDGDTWLRARAWALFGRQFELCQIADKNSTAAGLQRQIKDEVMNAN